MSRILIVYFSGTGGTKIAAEALLEKLNEKGEQTDIFPLDLSRQKALVDANSKLEDIDRLALLYPVYSFDAPKPVYRWLRTLPKIKGLKASIISVAGAGDQRPNRPSRQRCIRVMERKGFIVDHEEILAMPSNYFKSAGESINLLLIKALPVTMGKIADDIVQGSMERREWIFAPGQSITAMFFKFGAMMFGLTLYANKDCTDCKVCEKSCPTGNIKIKNGKMKTGTKCTWCMRCTYICPQNAVKSRFLGDTILESGFNIKDMKKRADKADEEKLLLDVKRNPWFDGAVDYLESVYK